MKNLTADDVRALMRKRIGSRSLRAAAPEFGVSLNYLSMVLLGDREPSGPILEAVGVERHVSYRHVDNGKRNV